MDGIGIRTDGEYVYIDLPVIGQGIKLTRDQAMELCDTIYDAAETCHTAELEF